MAACAKQANQQRIDQQIFAFIEENMDLSQSYSILLVVTLFLLIPTYFPLSPFFIDLTKIFPETTDVHETKIIFAVF